MDQFHKLAEEKIKEAIEAGEFDHYPGKGKPLNLEEDAHIPPTMRMAYRILKRAGAVPTEVSLAQELLALREKLTRLKSEDERAKLKREIALKDLELTMKLEGYRKQYGGV